MSLAVEFVGSCQDEYNEYKENMQRKKGSVQDEERKKKSLSFTFHGVTVDALKVVQRMYEIKNVKKKIATFGSIDNFKIPEGAVKPVGRILNCSWSSIDDVNLLKGVLKYGLGSYETIVKDDKLQLSDKITPTLEATETTKDKVRPNLLNKRIDILLRYFVEDAQKEQRGLYFFF